MAVSIIDGTIEQLVPAGRHPKVSRYKSILIRGDDGTAHSLANAVARGSVASELREGAHARFYTFRNFDLKGVHAVRRSDGTLVYDYPGTVNMPVFLMLLIANLAWLAIAIVAGSGIPITAIVLGSAGAVAVWLIRSGAGAARAQVDSDNAAVGASR